MMKAGTQAVLPNMQTEIKLLTTGNTKAFEDLLHIFKVAFEMDDRLIPGEEYLEALLLKKDFLVFVALKKILLSLV